MRTRLDGLHSESVCLPAMEAYALWAETYDEPTNPLLALEERMLEPLLPPLKGRHILDLACGTGRWLGQLVSRGTALAIGIDISEEMLQIASGKSASHGKLIRGDCLALPIQDRLMDLTLCSFSISYIGNLRMLASELARVSRYHGHVFLTDFHPSGYDRGWKRTFRHKDQVIEISSFVYSINAISEAFMSAGFRLLNRKAPAIDEPERRFFARSGKLRFYESVRKWPAIFVLHFQFSPHQGAET